MKVFDFIKEGPFNHSKIANRIGMPRENLSVYLRELKPMPANRLKQLEKVMKKYGFKKEK